MTRESRTGPALIVALVVAVGVLFFSGSMILGIMAAALIALAVWYFA